MLFENVLFKNCSFVNCRLLREIRFNNCEFSGCVFRTSFIADCSFMNCDISSLDFVFTHGLYGIGFDSCNLKNVCVLKSELLFRLTKSKLSSSTIDLSSLDIVLEEQASMINMNIEYSN